MPDDQTAAAYTRASVEAYLSAVAADRVQLELAIVDERSRAQRARVHEARLLPLGDGVRLAGRAPTAEMTSSPDRRAAANGDAAGPARGSVTRPPSPHPPPPETVTHADRTTVHVSSAMAPVSEVVPGEVVRQLVDRNERELLHLEQRLLEAEGEADEAEHRLAAALDRHAALTGAEGHVPRS